MNQIFPKRPTLVGEHYVHRIPAWLTTLLRLAFGIMAIATAILSYQNWGQMPLGFRGLVCVLVPALTFFALYKDMWGTIKFMAATDGIFFPCNELLVTVLGQGRKNAWLLVPWSNIANVRLAKYLDNDNDLKTCVAFDLRISQEEQARFFHYAGSPTDRARHSENSLSIAYGGTPPSPKKVFTLLQDLKLRQGTSFQGTRRDKAASRL
ncbi:hypothetical protein [Rhodoferax sp.]|uniref:hypothetical protein n=1 Tax=Rhodoferax sp. TaxID=50421 RepID=UPI00284C7D87|nr:hypothetical protein [Rhodoferax sp.]MDR3370403.1 hypothetical protein [Rhodoferax sp.]